MERVGRLVSDASLHAGQLSHSRKDLPGLPGLVHESLSNSVLNVPFTLRDARNQNAGATRHRYACPLEKLVSVDRPPHDQIHDDRHDVASVVEECPRLLYPGRYNHVEHATQLRRQCVARSELIVHNEDCRARWRVVSYTHNALDSLTLFVVTVSHLVPHARRGGLLGSSAI
jgi:hypothetical protein